MASDLSVQAPNRFFKAQLQALDQIDTKLRTEKKNISVIMYWNQNRFWQDETGRQELEMRRGSNIRGSGVSWGPILKLLIFMRPRLDRSLKPDRFSTSWLAEMIINPCPSKAHKDATTLKKYYIHHAFDESDYKSFIKSDVL